MNINNQLDYAAERGDLEEVKRLVKDGAFNDYCLVSASRNNHLDVVKYLLTSDDVFIPPCITYMDGLAFNVACEKNCVYVVKFFIEDEECRNKLDFEYDNCYAFRMAMRCNQVDIVKLLLTHPNTKDRIKYCDIFMGFRSFYKTSIEVMEYVFGHENFFAEYLGDIYHLLDAEFDDAIGVLEYFIRKFSREQKDYLIDKYMGKPIMQWFAEIGVLDDGSEHEETTIYI